MKGLTKRQREILEQIADFTENRGYPPTLADLATAMDLTSSTIQGHVDRLIRKGSLTRHGEGRRTLTITEKSFLRERGKGLPLIGTVHAGVPLEAIEEAELVELEKLLHLPKKCYLLKVAGDSMIEAGILDGDYVIIDPERQPVNGTVVVALVEGEATLKEFYREGKYVRLNPRNPDMKPILVPKAKIAGQADFIRGVMVGLIRQT